VIVTSLMLVCGFSALMLSGFQPTARFGLLVGSAIGSALIGDLVVLPAGLLLLAPRVPAFVQLAPEES